MNKIILSARDWRIYRALWLLMVMALVVDLCAVLMESDLLTTTAARLPQSRQATGFHFPPRQYVCCLSVVCFGFFAMVAKCLFVGAMVVWRLSS